MPTPAPASIPEVIALWPSLDDFAKDVGVPFHTARNWRARQRIPAWHWTKVIESAEQRKLRVDADLLARLTTAA